LVTDALQRVVTHYRSKGKILWKYNGNRRPWKRDIKNKILPIQNSLLHRHCFLLVHCSSSPPFPTSLSVLCAQVTLQPSTWGQHISLQTWYLRTKLHTITSLKTLMEMSVCKMLNELNWIRISCHKKFWCKKCWTLRFS
jgi:hypothetical protein